MKFPPITLRSIFLSTLLSVTATAVLAAPAYRGSVLDSTRGGSAVGIGPTGLVVGDTLGFGLAAMWNEAGALIAEIHPGSAETYPRAYAVNSIGEALIDEAFGFHTLLWRNGALEYLPAGSVDSTAYAINDRSQIAGAYYVTGVQFNPSVPRLQHAFLWTAGQVVDLGTLPGGSNSVALALNNNGQAAGYADTASGVRHAVIWRDGVIVDLGTLPGDLTSTAMGINDAGDVVGLSTAGTATRPFRWSNGVMTELGGSFDNTQFIVSNTNFTGSTLRVMNNAGQILGIQSIGGDLHAILWDKGVVTDLNPVFGDYSCSANGINDAGQIIGGCRNKGSLLKLVPTTPGVDVGVFIKATSSPVMVGQQINYTLTVVNAGAKIATGVSLTDTLPEGVTYISAVPSQGSCNGSTLVICALGDLAGGSSTTVQISVIAAVPGYNFNNASVTSTEADVNPVNDNYRMLVRADAPVITADLGVTMTDGPDPVKRRTNLTYAINVKNNGSANATGVTVADSLSWNMSLVSARSSQGSCSGTPTIICTLGNMASGASASVTIIVKPRFIGKYTNTVGVYSSTNDSNSINNNASVTTTVR